MSNDHATPVDAYSDLIANFLAQEARIHADRVARGVDIDELEAARGAEALRALYEFKIPEPRHKTLVRQLRRRLSMLVEQLFTHVSSAVSSLCSRTDVLLRELRECFRIRYRPLKKPNNIRTLVLRPAGNLTDTLVGNLEEHGLEDVPFTALSYSWAMEDGTSTPTKLLVLEGSLVLIGENLRDALRRLRQGSATTSRLWVDAVCINQRDDAEKSHQVAMMGSIYGTAAKVVAWLGEGNPHENRAAHIAIPCLRAEESFLPESVPHPAMRETRKFTLKHTWRYHFPLDPGPLEQPEEISSDAPECQHCIVFSHEPPRGRSCDSTCRGEAHVVNALQSLSRSRYLSRLWVVQELTVPHEDRIWFQWGSYSLQGNPLHILRDRWQINNHRITPNPLWSARKRSLGAWVAYTAEKQCSDPRDKLYAVLGCPGNNAMEKIRPDYSRSYEQVCADFVHYLLEEHDICWVLKHCIGLIGVVEPPWDLPSWVPDLRHIHNFETNEETGEYKELKRRLEEYLDPRISNDSLQLSCYLQYRGVVDSETGRDDPYGGPVHKILWEVDHPDPGQCRTNITASHVPEIASGGREVGEASFNHRAKVGDVLCEIPGLGSARGGTGTFETLFAHLRPSGTSGLWQFHGQWLSSKFKLVDPDYQPKERRLFHIV